MKRTISSRLCLVIATVMCLFLMPTAFAEIEKPSSWAEKQVTAAIAANLVPQSLQSQFTKNTTRAEFCALAVTFYETVTGGEITGRVKFDDTTDANVEKAASVNIVSGRGNNRFDPDSGITREEAAIMLANLSNAVGKPLPEASPTFDDSASISSWARTQVGRIQGAGIMSGVGENTFAPKGPYTREQSIITIWKLYDMLSAGKTQAGVTIIIFEAVGDQINQETLEDDINAAITTIDMRLRAMGYDEFLIFKVGTDRIRIEIHGTLEQKEAVALVETAKLEFRDYTGKVWLTADMVESVKAAFGTADNTGIAKHHVVLSFKPEYRNKWTEATKFAASQAEGDNYIAIYVDNAEVSAPRVGSEYASTGLTGESCIVTFGEGTNKELQQRAAEFANLVLIGRTPFDLVLVEFSSVDPIVP